MNLNGLADGVASSGADYLTTGNRAKVGREAHVSCVSAQDVLTVAWSQWNKAVMGMGVWDVNSVTW
jgi:hypothetical protein